MNEQPSLFIVIPAYNEEQSLGIILSELAELNCQIIVVDDCSTDATMDIALSYNVNAYSLPVNLGSWNAIHFGMQQALRLGAETIITFDADGQHQCKDILTLVAALTEKDNIIIGSCPQRGSFLRKMTWFLFRMFTNLKIRDITSGFRLYSSSAAQFFAQEKYAFLEFQDLGILLDARNHGLHIKEIPVHMSKRFFGKSHIFNSWFKVMYYLLYTFVIAFTHRK